jgi:hypothetical protein
MRIKRNCENRLELLLLETWNLLDGYTGKFAKFDLDIIRWVETLQMHVFELKWHKHKQIT